MAQLIFLNERSYLVGEFHPQLASQILNQLIDVLLCVKRILPRAALITSEPLPSLRLGADFSVAIWLNEPGVNRERVRFLLSLGQQAPFRVVQELFGDRDPGVTVYRIGADIVEGLGLADLYGGLPVSFGNDVRWQLEMITLDVEQLVEDGENKWTAEVHHASDVKHVETHRSWLTSLRRENVANAEELLAKRAAMMPFVEFGPGLESDLRALEPPAFLQVVEYLHRLNNSVEEWDQHYPIPKYPPGTNDEGETRKRLCNFPDPAGGRSSFTWHGKYTPGAGRIHFRLESNPKRVVLGYVGKKIGV